MSNRSAAISKAESYFDSGDFEEGCCQTNANQSLQGYAFQQHRQLRRADRQLAIRNRRPDEPSALQTLGEQARSLAIPPNDLDQIAATTAKDKEVAGIRVLAKNRFSQR